MLIIFIKNLEVESLGFNRHLLAEWQRRKDISGAQAARKIGISEMFYSELLRGVKNPSLKICMKRGQTILLILIRPILFG